MMKTKDPEKYEYAYLLYMQRVAQKDICTRVSVSAPTLGKWISAGGWEEKRAAKTISMDELIGKTLKKINELLDGDDFNADSFAKAVAQLKSLKTSNTMDDVIMTFMDFQNWLISQRPQDKTITGDLIKTITRLQDAYVLTRKANGKKQ